MSDWQTYFFGKWGKLSKGKPEDMECAKFCVAIRQAIFEDRFSGIFFHVPNEEIADQKPQTALIKKITGKIPGAADYVFISPQSTILIEMKAGQGRPSPNQKMFAKWCKFWNIPYYVCYGADEALSILERYEILFPPKLTTD